MRDRQKILEGVKLKVPKCIVSHSLARNMVYVGLGSIVAVAFASKNKGHGFDPRLDARFLPQHMDPPKIALRPGCGQL